MAAKNVSIGDRVNVVRRGVTVADDSDELTSKVLDVSNDKRFRLTMPKSKSATILMEVGEEVIMYFYTSYGVLSGRGVVKNRFFEDDSALITVELVTELKKIQRRQYYRLPCSIDARIHILTNNEISEIERFDGDIRTAREEKNIYINQLANVTSDWIACRLIDLSGGGIKCISNISIKVNELVILDIELGEDSIISRYFLLMRIKACTKKTVVNKYEIRTEFAEMKDTDRDAIVRFIFEEERKVRNRMNY